MYLELRGCKSAGSGVVLNAGTPQKTWVNEIVIKKISLESDDQSAGNDRIEARQSQLLLDDMQTLILLQDSRDGNQLAVDNNHACNSLIAGPGLLSAWSRPGGTKKNIRSVVVSQLISIGSAAAATAPRRNEHDSSFFSDESASEMQANNFEITTGTDLGTVHCVQDMKAVDLISASDQQLQALIPDHHQQVCGDSDLTSEHHMADPESSKSSTEGAPEYDVDHLHHHHAHLAISSGLNAAADTSATASNKQQQPAEDPSLPSAEQLMRIQPPALAAPSETNLNLVEQPFFPANAFLHDDRNTDHVYIDSLTRPRNQRQVLAEAATSKAGLICSVTLTSEPASTSGVVNSEAAEAQQSHDKFGYSRQQQQEQQCHDDENNNNNSSSSNKLMNRSTFNMHVHSCPGSLDHPNQPGYSSWTLAAAPTAAAGAKRRLSETGFNSEPPGGHEWLQLTLSSLNSAEAAAAAAITAVKTCYGTQVQSMSSDQALKAPPPAYKAAAAAAAAEPNLGLITDPREPGSEFLNSDPGSFPLCTSFSFGTRPAAAAAPFAVFNTSCTSKEGKTVHSVLGARACHNDLGLEVPLLDQLEICRAPSHPRPSSTDHDPSGTSYKRLQTLGQTSSAQITRQISTSSSASSTLMLMTTAAAAPQSCSEGELMRGAAAAGDLDDCMQLMSSSDQRSLTTIPTTTTHICTTTPNPGSSTSLPQEQQQEEQRQLPFLNCNLSSAAAAGHLQFQLLGRSASSSSSQQQQQPPDQTHSFSLPFPEIEFIGVLPGSSTCNNSLQQQKNPAAAPTSMSASPPWAETQAPAPPAAAARDFANCLNHINNRTLHVEPPGLASSSPPAQFLEGLMHDTRIFPPSSGIFPEAAGIMSSNTVGFSSSQSIHQLSETMSLVPGNNFGKEIQFGVLQDGTGLQQLGTPGHIVTGGPNNHQRLGVPGQLRGFQLPSPCPLPGLAGPSGMVHMMPSSGGFQQGAARLGWPRSSSSSKENFSLTTMTSENLGLLVVEGGGGRGGGNAVEKGSSTSSPDSLQKLLKSVPGPRLVPISQPPGTILPQDANPQFSFVKRGGGVLDPPGLCLSNHQAEGINQPSSSWMRQMITPWGTRSSPSLDRSLGFSGQVQQANVFNGEPSIQMRIRSSSLPGHHRGLWFTLQAAPNQTRMPILEQIPREFLHTKDEHMTVLVVKKYLSGKLGLESHSQVDISCNGQCLEPTDMLRHVRDTIWQARNNNIINNYAVHVSSVGECLTNLASYKLRSQDAVMVLNYSRHQHTDDQSPPQNLLHTLT